MPDPIVRIDANDDDDAPENNKQDIDVPEPVKPTFPENTISYDEVDLKITID